MNKNLKKIIAGSFVGALVLSTASCGGSSSSSGDGSITLDNKVGEKSYSITYEKDQKRAVSVAGFTTEMMLDLGLEDKMVGYAYQDNPVPKEFEKAISKIKELSKQNPSQEVLLAEKPDFLTGWISAFADKYFPPSFLEKNNIKMYIPRVEYAKPTMETVYEDYTNLGKIFKVEEKAKSIIEKMKKEISEIEDKVKSAQAVKVFVFDSGEEAPFTAGAGLPTDMIKRAGGKNVFGDLEENWTDVSWEKVVEANPDFIIVMKYDDSDDADGKIALLKKNPALKNIKAVKEDKIFVMGLSDVVAGPRNPSAIKLMAEKFHPELFK